MDLREIVAIALASNRAIKFPFTLTLLDTVFGVIFGLLPAYQASRLDPVDA